MKTKRKTALKNKIRRKKDYHVIFKRVFTKPQNKKLKVSGLVVDAYSPDEARKVARRIAHPSIKIHRVQLWKNKK